MLPYWPSVTPGDADDRLGDQHSAGDRRGRLGIVGSSFSRERERGGVAADDAGRLPMPVAVPGARPSRQAAQPSAAPGPPPVVLARVARPSRDVLVGRPVGPACRRLTRCGSPRHGVASDRPDGDCPSRPYGRRSPAVPTPPADAVVGARVGRAVDASGHLDRRRRRRRPAVVDAVGGRSDAVQIVAHGRSVVAWVGRRRRHGHPGDDCADGGPRRSCPVPSSSLPRRPSSAPAASVEGSGDRRRGGRRSSVLGRARPVVRAGVGVRRRGAVPLRPPLGYLAATAVSWAVWAAAVVAAPAGCAARAWMVGAIVTARRRRRRRRCCPAAGTSSAGDGSCSCRPVSRSTTRSCSARR